MKSGAAHAAVVSLVLAMSAAVVSAAVEVGRQTAAGQAVGQGQAPGPGSTLEKSLLLVTSSASGEVCAGVLLTPLFALVSTRCVQGKPPFNLTLFGPGDDEKSNVTFSSSGSAAASAGGPVAPVVDAAFGVWKQKRQEMLSLPAPNQAMAGAPPYPAVMLIRVRRPFVLNHDLQPVTLLDGTHDDARRPLRCSIFSWEKKQQRSDGSVATSSEPMGIVRTTVGAVLTHEQCRATTLVEHASQFCVEVPAEARGSVQMGSPLLCAGALFGVQDAPSSYPASSPGHYYNIFTNASHLLPWMKSLVPDLQIIKTDPSGVRTVAPTPRPTSPSGATAHSFNTFLPQLLAFAIALTARGLLHW